MTKEIKPVKGIIPVLPTPFTKEDEINYKVYGELIDYVIDNGVHAFVAGGTTGEYASMTLEERKKLMKFAVDHAAGRVPVIAGTYVHDSTKGSVELSKYAVEVGCYGALVTTPYYCPPDKQGMYQFYKTIADENPELAIYIYNVPGCTGVALDVDLIAELAKVPNIVSIKDTTDLIHTAKVIKATENENFEVATGEENLILADLAIGGSGGIGIISALIPKEMVKIYDLMTKENDVKAACELNKRLINIYCYTEDEPNPAPAKAALNLLGFDFGDPRLPILPASEDMYSKMREELTALGYEVK